jgi:hypothetical protein
MASRKQRGSGVGPSKSKKANTKKNNKKNTKKNKPKNANANANFNANVHFNMNSTNYHRTMAMARAAIAELKSQVNPNEVRQLRSNLKNVFHHSAQIDELLARPLKPESKSEQNAIEKALANLERNIAEGRV